MRIGVPRESTTGERRVAIVPEAAVKLVAAKHEVIVESGAGQGSGHDDDAYRKAGATVADRGAVFGTDVVLKVQRPSAEEIALLHEGSALIATIQPLTNKDAVRALAARINGRFAGSKHPAIILEAKHHEPEQVYEYYRGADVCFVSSLHDGMNLVAKEFVASREDDRGVLILSQFTGAARELPEALIVNPYDMDQCAAALNVALTMPLRTQRTRMRLMRGLISEFNVYRWAGRMLLDAATMRRRGKILGSRPLQPSRLARSAEDALPEVPARPTPDAQRESFR